MTGLCDTRHWRGGQRVDLSPIVARAGIMPSSPGFCMRVGRWAVQPARPYCVRRLSLVRRDAPARPIKHKEVGRYAILSPPPNPLQCAALPRCAVLHRVRRECSRPEHGPPSHQGSCAVPAAASPIRPPNRTSKRLEDDCKPRAKRTLHAVISRSLQIWAQKLAERRFSAAISVEQPQ